jgi:hypothetical protein
VDNLGLIVGAGAVAPLLLALEGATPLIQRDAARALGNLAANVTYAPRVRPHTAGGCPGGLCAVFLFPTNPAEVETQHSEIVLRRACWGHETFLFY